MTRGIQLTINAVEAMQREDGERCCGCGCGESIDHLSVRAKYLNRNHGQRAYRDRVRTEMERVGLPPVPSLRAARVSRATSDRNGDAENARNEPLNRKPSGPKMGYFKALRVLSSRLDVATPDLEAALLEALPAKQRERLEERRAA